MNDKHRFACAAGFLFTLLLGHAATPAHAQLVQVGPGFVKAPLVRVYWGPDGSSYVRAPFVSVHSPGYGYAVPQGPAPVDYQRMDWATLARTIRESARQLDTDLTRISSGDAWRTQLGTAELAALNPSDPAQPPDNALRDNLDRRRAAFDDVNGLPDANQVFGLASFRTLHAALREYVSPAEPRLRRQVIAASNELNAALTRFQTGTTWQQYLALPAGLTADSQGSSMQPSALTELLGRFDMVSRNDAYRMIAGLPAFRAAQQSLAAYAAYLQSHPQAAVEEIPAPESLQ